MTGLKEGELYYTKTGQTVPLGEEAADKDFLRNLNELISRLVAAEPAIKVPGKNCRYCKITSRDCAERVETK
jgi:hypothetical protein